MNARPHPTPCYRESGQADPSRPLSKLLSWKRARLADLPTPLIQAPQLARELGLDRLFIKMDAETGFALGGNKVRKLEFALSPDRVDGYDCVITSGGPQSNHCRVTAAYCARFDLRCILVVQEPLPERPTGNALLHRLFGAEIHTVPDRAARIPGMQAVATEVAASGGRPLILPIGASTGLGALGYALAAVELVEQLDALEPAPRTLLFLSSSSCGTLAGLLLGLELLGRTDIVPVAVSADAPEEEIRADTLRIAADAAKLLEADDPGPAATFEVADSQIGDGYGIPTAASREAALLFGRYAGTVLDQTYTAKAGAGMIDWIRTRGVTDERVVFLHTGGHPGLLS